MTQQFAPWVEPIAAEYRERRAEFVAFARALPAGAWHRPVPGLDWTCRELLSHVAGDTGQNLHQGLRAVIERRPVPPELFHEFDERNARDIEQRRGRTVDELIDELVDAGEETQRLLSLLRPDDEQRREDGIPLTLAELLRQLAQHDAIHLAQLCEAVAAPVQQKEMTG